MTPPPKTANRGMTRINRISEAPNKFPTKISGVLLIIEFNPTLNSGIEVRIPNTKKDTAKEDSLSLLAKRPTESIIIPEQYQRRRKAATYRRI